MYLIKRPKKLGMCPGLVFGRVLTPTVTVKFEFDRCLISHPFCMIPVDLSVDSLQKCYMYPIKRPQKLGMCPGLEIRFVYSPQR